MTRALLRLAGLAFAGLALSGCISLLPKSKPAQLYRFGVAAAPVAQPHRTVGVFRTNGSFQDAAAGDRILSVTGSQAAFIAESRWLAPAEVLFNEALSTAFDADPGHVRLLVRGQQGKADYALRLDVREFDTRYDAGPKAAPTVLVRVHAALARTDQSTVGERVFEVSAPASDNRVGDIVVAYDKAVADVIAQIVAWTNASAT